MLDKLRFLFDEFDEFKRLILSNSIKSISLKTLAKKAAEDEAGGWKFRSGKIP